jgi:hypothetical protein
LSEAWRSGLSDPRWRLQSGRVDKLPSLRYDDQNGCVCARHRIPLDSLSIENSHDWTPPREPTFRIEGALASSFSHPLTSTLPWLLSQREKDEYVEGVLPFVGRHSFVGRLYIPCQTNEAASFFLAALQPRQILLQPIGGHIDRARERSVGRR